MKAPRDWAQKTRQNKSRRVFWHKVYFFLRAVVLRRRVVVRFLVVVRLRVVVRFLAVDFRRVVVRFLAVDFRRVVVRFLAVVFRRVVFLRVAGLRFAVVRFLRIMLTPMFLIIYKNKK